MQLNSHPLHRWPSYLLIVASLVSCHAAPLPPEDIRSQAHPEATTTTPQSDALTRILIYGHGYSLFFREMGEPFRDDVLPTFVDTVNKVNPVAVFGLGDHTHGSSEAEWNLLGDSLDALRADVYLVRGNHDLRPLPKRYLDVGGIAGANRVVDIGALRFVLLDARPSYSENDLTFLREAVANPESRAGTFVLMHYQSFFDRPTAERPANVDPTLPYNGYSNWNQDVVPILTGHVDLIVSGDLYGRLVGSYTSPEGLNYVCTGLPFYGEGPLVMLELAFDADGTLVHMTPVVVPLDVRSPFYQHAFPTIGPALAMERGMGTLRTVAVLTDDNRVRLLDDSIANFLVADSWSHIAETLEAARNLGLKPSIPQVHAIQPKAWIVSRELASTSMSADAATHLILLNPTNEPATARLTWSTKHTGQDSLNWERIDTRDPASGRATLAAEALEIPLEPKAQATVRLTISGDAAIELVDVTVR